MLLWAGLLVGVRSGWIGHVVVPPLSDDPARLERARGMTPTGPLPVWQPWQVRQERYSGAHGRKRSAASDRMRLARDLVKGTSTLA